jgi:hypothetical protein
MQQPGVDESKRTDLISVASSTDWLVRTVVLFLKSIIVLLPKVLVQFLCNIIARSICRHGHWITCLGVNFSPTERSHLTSIASARLPSRCPIDHHLHGALVYKRNDSLNIYDLILICLEFSRRVVLSLKPKGSGHVTVEFCNGPRVHTCACSSLCIIL